MGNDEDQIRRTLGEYSQCCDDGRFQEWSDLFAEDARLILAGQTTEGRGAIRALMEAIQPEGARGRHITSHSLVDVDGDTATASTDYLFVRPTPDGLTLVATGRYHDQLIRDGSRWRFRQRAISLLGPPAGDADG